MKLEKRDYLKKELALLCNPGMGCRAACQKFYRDMYGCCQLMAELNRRGYQPRKHYLHFWQVRLIVEYVYPDMFD